MADFSVRRGGEMTERSEYFNARPMRVQLNRGALAPSFQADGVGMACDLPAV